MGYRSTFISDSFNVSKLPYWLKHRYGQILTFEDSVISTKKEIKIYGDMIFEDIQKAMNEVQITSIYLVVMGEDGSVSKVIISKDNIKYIKYYDTDEGDAEFIHYY